ncbi:MAG: ASKHA domain-containing protein [Thermodesulfovibrionales bacterium]
MNAFQRGNISLPPKGVKDGFYSIALDLGTTNLVALLIENGNGKIIARTKTENPQITYGSDILTRMHYAMSGKADKVHNVLIDGVNVLISRLCNAVDINNNEINALAVAGNTAMSHFFLGLDISTIPVAPFEPVVRKPGLLLASEVALDIHPEAVVFVFPNAGSYVGGDIISGILDSKMFEGDETSILIDVGTNAEVVIGNKDWLLVGAGAAGPALEEGISLIGKRAERGIIYDVTIENGSMKCSTFDNADPEGICGSGMVSLIYEMHREGVIGNDGVLNYEKKGVTKRDGEGMFTIGCCSGCSLSIRQVEIDNFLRSKAAMFTLLLVLLRSVGLTFGDVRRIYVAGALGNGIDVKKAAGIGMLPSWPQDIIMTLGNASLNGARTLLRDSSLLQKIDTITDTITYKHMHDDPEFMKEFMGAVFIPHTDPELLRI